MSNSRPPVRRFLLIAAFVAVPLILLLVNFILATEFERSRALAVEVERSHEMRAALQSLLSVHQDIETGQRGYALTGQPDFLEPYVSGRRRIEPALESLNEHALANNRLASDLPLLESLTRQKLQFASEVVGLTREGRSTEAIGLVATGRGQAIMDRLRTLVGQVDAAERAQLAERSEDAAGARQRAQRAAYALQTILIILLLAALWFGVRTFLKQRQTALQFHDASLRQQAIFDAATDGMIIHDRDGRIESHNPAIARLYGYGQDELVGRQVDVLFEKPPTPEQLHHFLDRLAANPRGRAAEVREFGGCRKDGSPFPVDVATSPVQLDDKVRFLAVIRDATQRKQVERMKSEFVSTVSHELRTPLTSIAGSLGLLRGGAAGEIPEKAARLIAIAHSNSERLVRLINDILDIEKIESGKMVYDLKSVSLRQLLDHSAEAMAGFAAQYEVGLEVVPGDDDATVIADEDRLTQVLTNLMSNAIKFSPRGERVEVSVRPFGNLHRIQVADRGPGIGEGFRNRIFDKFAQADSSDSRQKGGTGLGLNISREIVSAFGGAIGFEDREGGGTCFHVDLPAADLPAWGEEEGDRTPTGERGQPVILHVDDDPDTLRLVASAFEGQAEIHSTPSVREAHAALQRRRFDAAILDVQLSDGSGLDLLPILRDRKETVPTIIFSVNDATPALAERVDAIVTKSRSSLEQLVTTVMTTLNSQVEQGTKG